MHHREVYIGSLYGRLTVLEDLGIRQVCPSKRHRVYLCRCECGKTKEVPGPHIGKVVNSCGCLINEDKRRPVPIGERYGRLVVLSLYPSRKSHKLRYMCRCDCGRRKVIIGSNLASGQTQSCGCLHDELALQRFTQGRDALLVEGTNLGKIRHINPVSQNSSGVLGVSWHEGQRKWVARITFKGKTHSLGYYDSVDEAAAVRKKAEIDFFGNFLQQLESKKATDNRRAC